MEVKKYLHHNILLYHDNSDDSFAFKYAKEKLFQLSILMTCVMCLHFYKQGEEILEVINAKCHSCTLYLASKPWCNIEIHLITSFG